jgi:hypothetical protein
VGLCCVGKSRAKGDQQEEDWSWREPDGWCAEMAVVSGFVRGRGIPPVSTGVGMSDGGVCAWVKKVPPPLEGGGSLVKRRCPYPEG